MHDYISENNSIVPLPSFALVTGGCGFVGRHLIQKLIQRGYSIWIVDDLSTGKHPREWLGHRWNCTTLHSGIECYQSGEQRVLFSEGDIVPLLYKWESVEPILEKLGISSLGDIFHLASVVGGRAKIEGDPIAVAIDLAIDAALFRWVIHNSKYIRRVLYASSSAAYPIHLQADKDAIALKEEYIAFDERLGQPDMTYGWSKLTGEYLTRIAATHYGLHVACVRPFSGYGGDQDTSYPVPAIARRVALREDPLLVWGTGLQGRDFVHIDDCIDAMLLALNKIFDGSGINIGSGKLTTFLELASLFAELAGYSPQIKPLVDKPMGVYSRYADISLMETSLNWKPKISLRAGMKRVLEEQTKQVALQKGGK